MKMKMKMKKISTTVFVCSAFFVFFYLLQSNRSSISTLNNIHGVVAATAARSTKSPSVVAAAEEKRWELKSMSEQDPLQLPPLRSPTPAPISCDRSHHSYDICSIHGPTLLDPTTSTFYALTSANSILPPLVEKLRPYPRKYENSVMPRIKEITLTSAPPNPKCEVYHNAPALVFSAGGYTGNFWHDFNDGFIPLFITVNSVFPDQDFVLVISKSRDWWTGKYKDLLQAISKHRIINLDNDTSTHCFPSASLGLMSHGFMTIDPNLIPTKKTFTHFRALLAKAYGQSHPSIPSRKNPRPRLVLMRRTRAIGRAILNLEEAKMVAKEVGFDVIVFKPTHKTSLREAYGLINSSHAMVGVHGAALTHSLFLRPGSVFVQVVPLGAEWVSKVCFEKPARAMGLEYMEYRIGVEESSLVEKYGKDDMVVKDPVGLQSKGWSKEVMNIYLKEQNVKLDLVRFRGYMEKAYDHAKKFMDSEGY